MSSISWKRVDSIHEQEQLVVEPEHDERLFRQEVYQLVHTALDKIAETNPHGATALRRTRLGNEEIRALSNELQLTPKYLMNLRRKATYQFSMTLPLDVINTLAKAAKDVTGVTPNPIPTHPDEQQAYEFLERMQAQKPRTREAYKEEMLREYGS